MTLERATRIVALVTGAEIRSIIPPRSIRDAERGPFMARVRKLIGSARLADLTADRVQDALADLRDSGLALATLNHYRTAIRAFSKWCHRSGRMIDDPLIGVAGFNAKEDRRHDRRTLAVDDLRRLIDAAHAGPDYREMTGPSRSLCYRLAVATGLRFSEIKSIGPKSLDLAGDRPTVTVAAGFTKNGKEATLPLPADLAADLAHHLATRPLKAPVFPLTDRGAEMVRIDLEAAKIPYRDDAGFVFDFHSLRCQCATLADAAGISPRVVQRMMRHSDLALTDRYTRPRVADLDAAHAALPDLSPRIPSYQRLAATGTDSDAGTTSGTTDDDNHRRMLLATKGFTKTDRRIQNPMVSQEAVRVRPPSPPLMALSSCSYKGIR